MEVKRESKVWELINRERKKRARIYEGIEMEEWKEYFMGLLEGGVEGRVIMDGRGKREGRGEEEMDINREEVREAIKRLKDGKALGRDTWGSVEIWRGRSRGLDLEML